MLKEVSKILPELVCRNEIVCRSGGDEFSMLMPDGCNSTDQQCMKTHFGAGTEIAAFTTIKKYDIELNATCVVRYKKVRAGNRLTGLQSGLERERVQVNILTIKRR